MCVHTPYIIITLQGTDDDDNDDDDDEKIKTIWNKFEQSVLFFFLMK
jgi:hypothetical protein